ncbi:hypothetical protein [Parabacteroides sp. Marseille-P3160]|uniref:hypothetical protein n=1 Tax=Parabacteroides sp. Marseille-P3160 TaxID=1917887 RepID=UPI0009BB3641|nr:hypothetical protein [Parabacteroides sp. Marseille-P3160]
MDNLGDLIYILILGVIAVSGIFSADKKKKKEREARKQNPTPAGIPDLRELFGEFEEKKKNVSPPKPIPVIKEKPKPTPSPFLLTSEGDSEIRRKAQSTNSLFPIEEEHFLGEKLDFRDIDELKKAIIYSEIFNRKY